jgi:hypothetical protein
MQNVIDQFKDEFWDKFGLYLPSYFGHGWVINLGFKLAEFERHIHSNIANRFCWDESKSEEFKQAVEDFKELSLTELLIKYFGEDHNKLIDQILEFQKEVNYEL